MSTGVGRTNAPDTKVKAGGLAGTVTLLIVIVLGQFGVEVPPEAAAAITTLLGFLAAYFKRDALSPD